MRTRLAATFIFLARLAAAPAFAQGQAAPGERHAGAAQRREGRQAPLVASTLELTPQEAAKFWPIYDTYQRHLNAATGRSRSRSKTSSPATSRCPMPSQTARARR